MPYYHINPVVDSAISMTGDNEKWKAWSSLYRYNSTLGYLLLNTYGHAFNKSMESLGYDPVIGNICSAVPGNDGGGEQAVSRKKIIDPLKVEYLIKLINVIQANHIKLLVTTTPLVSDDTENGLYKEKMKEILTKLNVEYLDDSANVNFKGKCELFSDGSHLNSKGADEWTKQCVNYIKLKVL